MLRNTIECQGDVDRFICGVCESDVVFYLDGSVGTAGCRSLEQTGGAYPSDVLLFFSDATHAHRMKERHFAGYSVKQMTLFEYLFRWLPGMANDGALAGPDWNGDLVGLELDPDTLIEMIEGKLSAEQKAAHQAQYDGL